MMMVPHRMRSFMDSAHVVNWLNVENVCYTMYQNAYEQNLISDSELVFSLAIHRTPMRHLLVLEMAT